VAVIALALLSYSCAKKGFPGGGPPDTTPPEVMSTMPASGEVNVGGTAEIRIEFSEPVERELLLPNFFISPPLRGTPKEDWSKRAVTLRWSDTLTRNVTYRATIGTKLKDRHGNAMTDAYTFAFSTGAKIDSGRVTGRVWLGDQGAPTLSVFAYRLTDTVAWEPPLTPDSGAPPDFITQTGEHGNFDLPYLPAARFRILALGDKNQNLTPDPNELLAIAFRDVDLTGISRVDSLHLFARPYDTSEFALKGCDRATDGSILIGLTHPADTSGWTGEAFALIDSTSGDTLAADVLRPVPPHFTVIPMVCSEIVPGRTYTIATRMTSGADDVLHDSYGRRIAASHCTFTADTVIDTVGPRIGFTEFPDAVNADRPDAPLVIGFNEPIDTVTGTGLLSIYDTIGTAIAGQRHWLDRRQLQFRPEKAWPETTEVVVSLDSALLADLSGNPPPTQQWSWTFAPLTSSQMGAIACRIEMNNTDWLLHPCRFNASPPGSGLLVSFLIGPNRAIDLPLRAGKWILSAYVDLDGDGRFSYGVLDPFTPAEPRTMLADTVSVRARFTLEDVVIRF
jgi:hypothetical protein